MLTDLVSFSMAGGFFNKVNGKILQKACKGMYNSH